MSALGVVCTAAMNEAYSDSTALLAPFLLEAEQQLKEYSASLPLLPDYNVHSVRNVIAAKRVELWSKAIGDFLIAQAPIVGEKIGGAVHGYLEANNAGVLVPLSLTAPGGSGGPVVSAGGPVTITVYP